MNVFGIGFLVLASLVGGGIALFADNLGRTIGKKRITVRKLRPRRTAQIFTFSAGALIPLLTVGVVAFASEGVRRWFVEGPQVVGQRDRLLTEVKDLNQDIQAKESERVAKVGELERVAKQLAAIEPKLKSAETKLAEYRGEIAKLNDRMRAASARLVRLEAQNRRVSGELTGARIELNREKLALARTTQELASRQQDLNNLQRTFNELMAQRDAAYGERDRLDKEVQQLEKDKTALSRQLESLQSQMGDLSADLDQTQKDLSEASRNKERAELELDELKGRQKVIQDQLEMMMKIGGNSRLMPMTYRSGEELARVSVSANLSRGDAQNALSRLLRESRVAAEERGARANGPNASAGIVEKIVEGRPVRPETQVQSLVDRITGLSEEFVIIATSTFNAFRGEPVAVEVQTMRNPIVFTQGELVAEARIDGDKVENVLVEQIAEFVRNQVREKAKERGMIPTLGQETGYGVLDQNEMLDLMRTARANNRRVRIQAWAPKDIRAADLLDLDYRIR